MNSCSMACPTRSFTFRVASESSRHFGLKRQEGDLGLANPDLGNPGRATSRVRRTNHPHCIPSSRHVKPLQKKASHPASLGRQDRCRPPDGPQTLPQPPHSPGTGAFPQPAAPHPAGATATRRPWPAAGRLVAGQPRRCRLRSGPIGPGDRDRPGGELRTHCPDFMKADPRPPGRRGRGGGRGRGGRPAALTLPGSATRIAPVGSAPDGREN